MNARVGLISDSHTIILYRRILFSMAFVGSVLVASANVLMTGFMTLNASSLALYAAYWANATLWTHVLAGSPVSASGKPRCARCGYCVGRETDSDDGKTLDYCPECGADLRALDSVVRWKRMSRKASTGLYWVLGLAWAISTGGAILWQVL